MKCVTSRWVEAEEFLSPKGYAEDSLCNIQVDEMMLFSLNDLP